jgi:hypothetical protein
VSTAANPDSPAWARLQRNALVAGAAGLAVCGLGALFGPAYFFRAYLVGYQFWLGVALGCLVILMLQYLTGGRWGLLLRRLLESGARTLLLLAVLFVPVLLGIPWLYRWFQEGAGFRSWYFYLPFFIARTVFYFLVWFGFAYTLDRLSARLTPEQALAPPRNFRMLSAVGLVGYGLTITLASIDWVMSLEPNWYSTIYPVLFGTGQVLSGLAFAVAVLLLLASRPPLAGHIGATSLRDLGNLLLAFVMLWAYMSISQFLLIWTGNLPEENPWYLRRTEGGWQFLAVLLIVLHFALPFLLLLARAIKEDPRKLLGVAVLVLVMRFFDVLWWIEPAFGQPPGFFLLLDVAAVVGVGGIGTWWFLRQLERRPPLPLIELALREPSNHGVHAAAGAVARQS